MKPASRVYPNVSITVHGRVTRRMKVGLKVMRLGVWLINDGGIQVTYSSNVVKRVTEAQRGGER
jgi:hypothetical protein